MLVSAKEMLEKAKAGHYAGIVSLGVALATILKKRK